MEFLVHVDGLVLVCQIFDSKNLDVLMYLAVPTPTDHVSVLVDFDVLVDGVFENAGPISLKDEVVSFFAIEKVLNVWGFVFHSLVCWKQISQRDEEILSVGVREQSCREIVDFWVGMLQDSIPDVRMFHNNVDIHDF